MKLFIAFAVLVMSCGSSCDILGPTNSGSPSGYEPRDPDPQTCASYCGKVVDDSTGQYIYSARIYLNEADSQMTGSVYPGGYKFEICSSTVPPGVKIKVTHPDYHPDSLVQSVTHVTGTHRHDFKLTRK